MILGGLQKNSLIDFPGKISSVVFTRGCNFKCPYCHNPELIPFEKNKSDIEPDEIFDFLKARKGFIDAVVITGGEPCLQKDILKFTKEIKKMGFLVKLDTNGSRPHILEKLLNENLLDLVAMDIKTPFDQYNKLITNEKNIEENLRKSINLIISSNTDYYFRTTSAKPFVTKENLIEIIKEIKGTKKYVLQKFKDKKVLDPDFFDGIEQFSDDEFKNLKSKAEEYIRQYK
ncbi:MAG: anaerobic ribonucleoside-triphosphate reductase activating protein [Desulforegulaceae bacterium]|nr:anaerobic ribonucleoside-triphosphate reductase activating protein [Desulforegulaceae bacterium]